MPRWWNRAAVRVTICSRFRWPSDRGLRVAGVVTGCPSLLKRKNFLLLSYRYSACHEHRRGAGLRRGRRGGPVPLREGSEWETFYQDLAADFGLDIGPANYVTGTESVFDDIAASASLVTYVSEQNRLALPAGSGLLRLPVTNPVPLYPWSLIWSSPARHPGLRSLITHTRRAFQAPDPATAWLPRQARDDFAPGRLGNSEFLASHPRRSQ